MKFRTFIGVGVLVLVIAAMGSNKPAHQNAPAAQPAHQNAPTATTQEPKIAVPVICNEADHACRAQAERRRQQAQENDARWKHVQQHPEDFCETFRNDLAGLVPGQSKICLSDDPTYKATRDAVRDALRR